MVAAAVLALAGAAAAAPGDIQPAALLEHIKFLSSDELQGRVNTTGRMIAWGGTPFGALLGGITADLYNVRVAYVMLAVPAAISLSAVLASPVRNLRLEVD